MNYEGLKSSDRIEDGAKDSLVPVSSEVSNLFLAVVLAVLICVNLPSIPEDLVHVFLSVFLFSLSTIAFAVLCSTKIGL
jgi:flagellar biosynthesis protein FlhB